MQKFFLVFFGILCCVVLIEGGLRLGGLALSSFQQYKNYISIKEKGTYRILCLGESTTANQYPPFLEKVLNHRKIGIKFSVIDKGINACNTSQILFNLNKNLDSYHPDMVITMMGINDSGPHMPSGAISDPEAKNFWKSFRVYKLTRLLCLHIVTRIKERNLERLGKYTAKTEFLIKRGELGQVYTEDKALEFNLKKRGEYVDLGQLLRSQGRFSEAEASIKKALELNPQNENAYFQLGSVYADQKRFTEAEAPFKKAIELNPQNVGAYIELFLVYTNQKRFIEAEASIKKALELNPQNENAYFQLGSVYEDQKRFTEAEALFKKAIALDAQNNGIYIDLLQLFRSQGKLSEAESSFKKAIELNPQNDRAYVELGWVYEDRGRFSEAEASFKKAIEFNPANYRAWGGLKVLHIEMGDRSLAREYDKKAKEAGLYYFSPITISNYNKLKALLDKRGITYLCVQYPLRYIAALKKIFAGQQRIIFVDNEEIFKDAVSKEGYKTYFKDAFGGAFGHCTYKGNMLLAENIANVILKEVFGK